MVSTKEMPNKHTRTISLDYRPSYPVHSRVSKHHSKWSLLFMSSSTTYDLSSLLNRPIVHSANPSQFLLDLVPLLALAALDSRQGVRGLVLISLLYLSHHKDSLFLPVSPTRTVSLSVSVSPRGQSVRGACWAWLPRPTAPPSSCSRSWRSWESRGHCRSRGDSPAPRWG